MLVLVSGAARVLGSKFVDDLLLKAGASQSFLDTVLCDGTWYYGLIIDESMFYVCNGESDYIYLCECLDLVMNESILYDKHAQWCCIEHLY